MKRAIIFPGQGAQSAGMGQDMYENNVVYRAVFNDLDGSIGFSLKKACFEGCKESEFVQPAILAHSICLLRAMNIKSDIYAGLSLGEYTALVAGGVINEDECISLVNKRGAIMDSAVETGTCSMVSALGLTIKECEKIADIHRQLYIANHISEKQIVFAGTNGAIDIAIELIENQGAKAIRLNTAGPYHSPMLNSAAEEFRILFDKVKLNSKKAIIYSNYTGLPYEDNSNYSSLLANQMSGRVRWYDICEHMISDGVTQIIEVGPGMVLSKVLKRRTKGMDIDIVSVRDLKTFTKFMSAKGV